MPTRAVFGDDEVEAEEEEDCDDEGGYDDDVGRDVPGRGRRWRRWLGWRRRAEI